MKEEYIAIEAMGVVIILVLLYANIFELKLQTRKRSIFTKLLLLNGIVVSADAVSWMDLGWKDHKALLGILLAIVYIVPFLVVGAFSAYIYEHISCRSEIDNRPFHAITFCSMIVGALCLILCICGKMFTIRDGKYYPTSLETCYYIFYILIMIFFSGVITLNRRKLGFHDYLATMSFCVLPMLSIALSITFLKINLAVPSMVVDMLVIYIMLQAERENRLLYQSNNDELTGLYNRRAYEDDMLKYPDVPPEENFVYASVDINGLKQVNDNLGHAAGDELICGAALCLKRSFGARGSVYRVGGDEFVSIFFADEDNLNFLMEDLKEQADRWKGEQVNSLAISVGYASKREFPDAAVKKLMEISEKRMYEDKRQYYAKKGVDRRGQNEAHKVLCSLYTKILRINITENTFSVVNMNVDELSEEKGYSESISGWLEGFAERGGVHPDDLEEYLSRTNLDYMRNYFRRRKTSLTLLYRRKYDDGFKQVMMEIIPANDYSDENQSLFLYVKKIDI